MVLNIKQTLLDRKNFYSLSVILAGVSCGLVLLPILIMGIMQLFKKKPKNEKPPSSNTPPIIKNNNTNTKGKDNVKQQNNLNNDNDKNNKVNISLNNEVKNSKSK